MKERTRTCIGCGKRLDKRALFRIVRSSEGEVAFDATGRAAGRGAYLCSSECLRGAVEKHRLSRALKCEIGRTDIEQVERAMRSALESDAR